MIFDFFDGTLHRDAMIYDCVGVFWDCIDYRQIRCKLVVYPLRHR